MGLNKAVKKAKKDAGKFLKKSDKNLKEGTKKVVDEADEDVGEVVG